MTRASRSARVCLPVLFLLSGCLREPTPARQKGSLSAARREFKSKPISRPSSGNPAPEPPPEVFRKVSFESPVGKLAAYISQVPDDGRKRPAIVWISGGDCNSIDEGFWQEAPRSNDQTASVYWKRGIITMFPSLRGGNDNPGRKEGFLGEVNDVLAAADYLAALDSVDPKRIYLGGHSTGGTLALLVAECTDRFRAVFSFGPVSDVSGYDAQYTPFDVSNPREVALRSPGGWLHSVRGPTFVFEGNEQGNLSSLEAMERASTNPLIRFLPVEGANHFSILGPTNELIARKILQDIGTATNIDFSTDELNRPFRLSN
jgi:acetyl esterase/lipase